MTDNTKDPLAAVRAYSKLIIQPTPEGWRLVTASGRLVGMYVTKDDAERAAREEATHA